MKPLRASFLILAVLAQNISTEEAREGRYIKDKIKAAFECVREILKEGIPEVSLPILDPLQIENLDIDLNTLNIENVIGTLNLTNLLTTGLASFTLSHMKDYVTVLPPSYELEMHFNEPEIELSTDYVVDAEIFGTNVSGKGEIKALVKELVLDIGFKGELRARRPYLEYAHIYPTIQDFDFEITGLINDDISKLVSQIVSESVPATINDNSKQIGDKIGEILMDYINTMYSSPDALDLGAIIEAVVDKCS